MMNDNVENAMASGAWPYGERQVYGRDEWYDERVPIMVPDISLGAGLLDENA